MAHQNLPEHLQVLSEIARYLLDVHARYFVTGSFASSVYGEFRATNDLDIVAELTPDQGRRLASAATTFFADEQAISAAIIAKQSFNLIHEQTVFKVDIFTNIDELAREQIERAIPVNIPGSDQRIPVASAEDVIISKLVWYQKGNRQSERQWRDILGVIKISGPNFDRVYLNRWCNKLGILDLISAAFSDAAK
jgi:hypothetical protein